jgi:hydroxyethylthiazole kinase
MSKIEKSAFETLEKMRRENPLVHNITNYVVMNYTANALLSMGASPVMAHAEEEVAEMASIAGALVINIGTLSGPWIASMLKAGRSANSNSTPVILDPVGAGATRLRTDTAKKIAAEVNLAVVRGNASEVLSMGGKEAQTKGVDSTHDVDQAKEAAVAIAKELNTVVAITGKVDLVTDGNTTYRVHNGHELMGMVTGTGCAATATIGAFCAVCNDALTATVSALAYFGLAGEVAAGKTNLPGSYAVALIDALNQVTPEMLSENMKIEV